jgi:hypothetical protein
VEEGERIVWIEATLKVMSRKECVMMAIIIVIIIITPLVQLEGPASNYCRKFHGTLQHTQGSFQPIFVALPSLFQLLLYIHINFCGIQCDSVGHCLQTEGL